MQAYYEKQVATWANVVKMAGVKAE